MNGNKHILGFISKFQKCNFQSRQIMQGKTEVLQSCNLQALDSHGKRKKVLQRVSLSMIISHWSLATKLYNAMDHAWLLANTSTFFSEKESSFQAIL